MKFLIWFLCMLGYGVIRTLIESSGIILGGLPTVILLGGAMALANILCKAWDAHKAKKAGIDDEENSETTDGRINFEDENQPQSEGMMELIEAEKKRKEEEREAKRKADAEHWNTIRGNVLIVYGVILLIVAVSFTSFLADFSFSEGKEIVIIGIAVLTICGIGGIVLGIVHNYKESVKRKIPKENEKHPSLPPKAQEDFLKLFKEALDDATENAQNVGNAIFNKQRPYSDDFGRSESNPIFTSSLSETENYLNKLCTREGEKFTWSSYGTIRATVCDYEDVGEDVYMLYWNGKAYTKLYFVLYVGDSKFPPAGLCFYGDDTDWDLEREAFQKGITSEQLRGIRKLEEENKKHKEEQALKEKTAQEERKRAAVAKLANILQQRTEKTNNDEHAQTGTTFAKKNQLNGKVNFEHSQFNQIQNERNLAMQKRIAVMEEANKKKKIIKTIIICAVIAIIALLMVNASIDSEHNSEFRNFATKKMDDDYTNVYADVVSMEPEYFVYTTYGSSPRSITDVICKCETVEGKIIWVVIDVWRYPEGNSYDEMSFKTQYYSESNPMRLKGSVTTAKKVIGDLEDEIGDIFVLDVNELQDD